VVDGDTVHVRLENGKKEKVRFIGVDTPESTREVEPYGKEAAGYTEKRLDGKTVYLELDVAERDKYGRLLAYIWLSPPENGGEAEVRAKMFNAELLLEGYAQAMTVPPNVKYADLFAKLQREARDAGKGLWGVAASGGAAGFPALSDKQSAAAPAAVAKYIGNARSKKFHRPDCEWAQKIAPENRVEFETREEAVEALYVPCKVCKP
jgi:micrococcal nuclease